MLIDELITMRVQEDDTRLCRLTRVSVMKSGLAVRSGGDLPQTATHAVTACHSYGSELVVFVMASRVTQVAMMPGAVEEGVRAKRTIAGS